MATAIGVLITGSILIGSELEEALGFFDRMANGKIRDIEVSIMLKHQFRVAMPGTKAEVIDMYVQYSIA